MKPLKPASLVLAALLASEVVSVCAQTTAFTYQGRLRDNTIPAVGVFDLRFALYDAPTGGNQVGSFVTADDLAVTNGLFCVVLDFGVSAFTGADRWLETSLRPGAETGAYTVLFPRRALTATPYASYASNAGTAATAASVPAVNLTGTVPLARLPAEVVTNHEADLTLSGAFSGSGAGLTGVNADLLDGQQGAFYQNAANLLAGTLSDARLSTSATAAIGAANAATGANTPNTIVKRDASGAFAGTVTGTFSGDGSGLTNIKASSIVGEGGDPISLGSGMTVVSALANDPALVSHGYRMIITVPAPAWVNAATFNAASARARHTAVWDGQRLIIWGGKITPGASYVGTGAMYHPNSDSWETVSTISAPAPRANHTAVWSGTEMIVWGGDGASTWLDTGARFSPDQQEWRAVSATGAPAGRSGHVAVWTGARMLIWGGQNVSGVLNDGALYDPAADQWSALALPNPPTPRARATSLWADDRVIIWGGEGSAGVLNSGSQLLFANGAPSQWLPLPSANAPAARRGHTAVWTGQKLIVWGGEADGAPLDGGAAFDPAANTWTALASVGSPVARFNHAVAWTGQEMLIVGGSTSATELASGSAYDPGSASWWLLSSAGSPQPRTEATASWTGTELLVFGGRAQGQFLSALQRLVPQPVWYFYRKL